MPIYVYSEMRVATVYVEADNAEAAKALAQETIAADVYVPGSGSEEGYVGYAHERTGFHEVPDVEDGFRVVKAGS